MKDSLGCGGSFGVKKESRDCLFEIVSLGSEELDVEVGVTSADRISYRSYYYRFLGPCWYFYTIFNIEGAITS